MMKKHLIAILLLWQVAITCGYRSARLRRQVIPSEHIQVHSLDSSVLLQDLVVVDSSENRIDLDEAKVKGSIWSDKSLLSFDSQDTFVNVSAANVDSFFNIQNCAMLHAQAGDSDFFMRTNRTEDGNSAISQNLNGMANFSIVDEGLNVQAVGGRRVELEAQSWEKSIDKEMSLSSYTTPTFEKIIQLKAIASPYNIEARFFGSTIFISFADKVIRIDPLTKNIIIFTDKFTVEVRVNETDYGVTMNPKEVVVALPVEETTVCVDLAGVSVTARKLAKTTIERNGGEMNVGGLYTNADSVQINSLSTELTLTNEGKTTAEALNSEMMMSNPLQKIHLASARHHLAINGGVPHIFIEPGYICVDIKANHGMPHFMNIMPPFIAPDDKFVNIGPFGAVSSLGGLDVAQSPPASFLPSNIDPHSVQIAPPPVHFSAPPVPLLAMPPPRKITPNFELFNGMAADLPQNKPPAPSNITSNTPHFDILAVQENSTSTSPRILQTTLLPKKKVTIDEALLRNFAADLPQNRSTVNETVHASIPTTSLPSAGDNFTTTPSSVSQTTSTPRKKVTVDMTLLRNFAADLTQNRSTVNDRVPASVSTTPSPSTTSASTTTSTTTATKMTIPDTTTARTTTRRPETSTSTTTTTVITTQSTSTSTISTTADTRPSTTYTTTTPHSTTTHRSTASVQPLLTRSLEKNQITNDEEDINRVRVLNVQNTTSENKTGMPLTTLRPQTTTSLSTTSSDPLAELAKLRAELKRIETLREWEEQQVSQDHDGDEQLEEFTYPNGTTVQRRIKTRRKIVTTVTHRHKQRIDENGNITNLTPDNASAQNQTVVKTIGPKTALRPEVEKNPKHTKTTTMVVTTNVTKSSP